MPQDRYHHGDLRRALVEAATDLARQGGPDAVVVREAARMAGVSHNAVYRHFSSREELLDAVAIHGLHLLAQSMEKALAEVAPTDDAVLDAWERLRSVGRGYLRFALNEPGLFRTAFGVVDDPHAAAEVLDGVRRAGLDSFLYLQGCVDDLVALGEVDPARRANSEVVLWSAVHGLATLVLDGPLRSFPAPAVDEAFERLCDVMQVGL